MVPYKVEHAFDFFFLTENENNTECLVITPVSGLALRSVYLKCELNRNFFYPQNSSEEAKLRRALDSVVTSG